MPWGSHVWRSATGFGEGLHKALKPGVPYLPAGATTLFHAGPWPYGLQRQAINKAFQAFGWVANATQPVQGAASGGQWWAVHAEGPPPRTVMPSQVGAFASVE